MGELLGSQRWASGAPWEDHGFLAVAVEAVIWQSCGAAFQCAHGPLSPEFGLEKVPLSLVSLAGPTWGRAWGSCHHEGFVSIEMPVQSLCLITTFISRKFSLSLPSPGLGLHHHSASWIAASWLGSFLTRYGNLEGTS